MANTCFPHLLSLGHSNSTFLRSPFQGCRRQRPLEPAHPYPHVRGMQSFTSTCNRHDIFSRGRKPSGSRVRSTYKERTVDSCSHDRFSLRQYCVTWSNHGPQGHRFSPPNFMIDQRQVPLWFLQEYLALIANADESLDAEERVRLLIFHHAELNYKLFGGGRCSLCNSAVRHIILVATERNGRQTRHHCLCTRCLEGERAVSERVVLRLGRAAVEYKPRPEAITKRWNEGQIHTALRSKAARQHS
jgi:hypothetical protein